MGRRSRARAFWRSLPMIWHYRGLAVLSILNLVLVGGPAQGDVFHFACPQLPFPAVTQSRAIDLVCGVNGDQTVPQSWWANPRSNGDEDEAAPAEISEPKALQNSLKNNICR